MKLEVKSGTRCVKRADRFGVLVEKVIHVVEVWIGGICTMHECDSPEQARAMVLKLSRDLGVG